MVPLSDLNVFDICWKSDMVENKIARAFFEDIRFNFLIQALNGQTDVASDCICYSQSRQM